MELRQLVYFEAVVRCGGFTRAAEQLRIAQPAVSAQIRRLETELGTILLQRTTRHVALTHAGELFLARTRRILDELDGARSDLADIATVLRGRVRIGATAVLGPLALPATLAQFRRRYPGLGLALRSGLIAELIAGLDAGAVDVVLGPIHADLPDTYLSCPLVEETLVLVTGPDYPIAVTSLADVRDEPFVCLPARSGLHAILTAAAAAEGFEPRIEFETQPAASIRELVAAGLGVALMAGSVANAPGPPIAVHELEHGPAHPPIGVIHRRDRPLTAAAQAFRDHLIHSGQVESIR